MMYYDICKSFSLHIKLFYEVGFRTLGLQLQGISLLIKTNSENKASTRESACLRDFRQSKVQISLLSYRDQLKW